MPLQADTRKATDRTHLGLDWHRSRRTATHARSAPEETPGQAHARRRSERREAHMRTALAMRELDAAISAGERAAERLESRLLDAGRRSDEITTRLRRSRYIDPGHQLN
ncbi:MAG: hypothetical protein QOI71_1854 [Gaiellales bacterium]|nr:hypothetical protein [Gaiellales bacterium]